VVESPVARRRTWRRVPVVGRTLVRHVMRSSRSTGGTATRRSTAAAIRTRDAGSTYSSLTTPTHSGGQRLSTTGSTTLNSHTDPALVMGSLTDPALVMSIPMFYST